MSEPRQIAVVRDYDGLIEACRSRARDLNVSREAIDAISGMTKGYSAKLLADPPVKHLGANSLGRILSALSMYVVLFVDERQQQRDAAAELHIPRNNSQVRADGRHPPIIFKLSRYRLKRLAKKGGKARAAKLSKRRLSQIGRRAANARWSKPQIVEVTDATKRAAILDSQRAGGAEHSRPRADAHQPARIEGRKARPGK
jgi:hypothetical protein